MYIHYGPRLLNIACGGDARGERSLRDVSRKKYKEGEKRGRAGKECATRGFHAGIHCIAIRARAFIDKSHEKTLLWEIPDV